MVFPFSVFSYELVSDKKTVRKSVVIPPHDKRKFENARILRVIFFAKQIS